MAVGGNYIWHMTCDTWQGTHDKCVVLFLLLFSFLSVSECFGIVATIHTRREIQYLLYKDFFSRPGRSQGCSTNTFVINSLIQSTAWRWCFSHKIDYVTLFKETLNLEGHLNRITGSKDTAILLNGWICLLVELQRWRVCVCSLRSSLVYNPFHRI